MKAPGVDTSFLPDRYRDEEVRRERERLAEEWRQEQARMKGVRLALLLVSPLSLSSSSSPSS